MLCAMALTAGGATRSVAADTGTPVRLGVGTDSITMTPFYLAEKMGYFKAEGLNVEFVPLPSAALMIAPLGAGQLDAGGGAISAGLYNAVGRGIDLRIVADLGSDPPGFGFQTLVVRNSLIASGGYKSVKDLKGKRIAITARGISTSALVAALLKTGGLTMNDVTRVVDAIRNSSAPISGTTVRSRPTMPPTKALTRTSSANWRQFSASPRRTPPCVAPAVSSADMPVRPPRR